MTKKQPGDTFQYENILYSIGGWMQCSEGSDYAGLSGVIVEIRDGEDRETDTPAPDIYCRLQMPRDVGLVQRLEARFSDLYEKTVKITEIPLDRVILQPDKLRGISGEPDCYSPETDNPYPLCVGNGGLLCEQCCLYKDLDYNRYE